MSFFDAIPPTIITIGSFLFLAQRYIKINGNNHDSPKVISTYTTDNKNERFSTIKREITKLGICIIQVSLFSFLLGWKIDEKANKVINKNSLYNDIIHAGLLIFCWVSFKVFV